jgi:hypothetical protein
VKKCTELDSANHIIPNAPQRSMQTKRELSDAACLMDPPCRSQTRSGSLFTFKKRGPMERAAAPFFPTNLISSSSLLHSPVTTRVQESLATSHKCLRLELKVLNFFQFFDTRARACINVPLLVAVLLLTPPRDPCVLTRRSIKVAHDASPSSKHGVKDQSLSITHSQRNASE